jgi:signal transduction histidine kinase/ActR/RegA family two-component response regulator
MSIPSLKEFVRAVPVCKQTSGFAAVLEIFRSSGCDAVAVVSEQQQPLGIVSLRRVFSHLLSKTSRTEQPEPNRSEQSDRPFDELEPVTAFSAHMSLSQFGSYLQGLGAKPTPRGRQESSEREGDRDRLRASLRQELPGENRTTSDAYWIVTEPDGTFLGLLDRERLLYAVAPLLATSTTPEDSPCQSAGIHMLVELLEYFPLPLSLQTSSDRVIAHNRSWRQQVGISPEVGAPSFPPTLSIPESPVLPEWDKGSSRPYPLRVDRGIGVSGAVAVQHHCAIDTPSPVAIESPPKTTAPLPLLPSTLERMPENASLEEAAVSPSGLLHADRERSFSFVKIPLTPEENQGQGTEPSHPLPWGSHTCSPYRIATANLPDDLCLVLAQDTTEQQQVAQELAAKNADLVQLNRLKDEFLACVSHELKTPLTAVLGLSTLLKDQTLGALNDRQARYARLIYQSGRQLMTVVNDILDLTRMETGQLELSLEPVNIRATCDRAYAQAQQRPSEKEQFDDEASDAFNFTLEIEPGLEEIVADELRLRQMLAHLLSNALKFTEDEGEIGLRVNCWDGWIAFTVWDTGIGIPPEKQHLIFEKFQQLESPLTRRFEGTGLGLVLTQRLAHLHGGDVSFISKVGQGSQFTLLLPPCPPQTGPKGRGEAATPTSPSRLEPRQRSPFADAKPATSPTPSPQNRLVLIVEAVPRYLESSAQQLQELGYRAIVARSGTEALTKARNLQPCAILLNPLLPQLSGWDVLTLLKSDAQTQHIPILVTATQAEKRQAFHNKAEGFLTLPVQKHDLSQHLSRFSDEQHPTPGNLTILHLNPESTAMAGDEPMLSSELSALLSCGRTDLNCRILEAEDLEQAEMLARVWRPDVILLEGVGMTEPLAYLQALATHASLVTLPLVTLDRRTTEAANQISELSVYPCLATDDTAKIAALLQVMQVAAGMSRQSSILIADVGKSSQNEELSCQETARILKKGNAIQIGASTANFGETVSPLLSISSTVEGEATQEASLAATSIASQSSWLQALNQYLQAAGLKSLISSSWEEVLQTLQHQSVDLLLIRLTNVTDSSALEQPLTSLIQLPQRPPILVVDCRFNETQTAQTATVRDTASEVESLLNELATQILRSPALSMSQLLNQIQAALAR